MPAALRCTPAYAWLNRLWFPWFCAVLHYIYWHRPLGGEPRSCQIGGAGHRRPQEGVAMALIEPDADAVVVPLPVKRTRKQLRSDLDDAQTAHAFDLAEMRELQAI